MKDTKGNGDGGDSDAGCDSEEGGKYSDKEQLTAFYYHFSRVGLQRVNFMLVIMRLYIVQHALQLGL